MLTRTEVEKILQQSINCPSGGNSQPWSFSVRDNEINLIAYPEKDHAILNYHDRGTWIAHGALIENIKITAASMGFKTFVELFPDSSNPKISAKILFKTGLPNEEDLARMIPLRTSNRKPYLKKPLTYEQKKYLHSCLSEVDAKELDLVFIEKTEEINKIGSAVAANEIVTLENQVLHKLFFNEIIWRINKKDPGRPGFPLGTMELKPPESLALRLFSYWPLMQKLTKIGIARKIAASNAKKYASAPILAAVLVPDSDTKFIDAGRLIERLWLKATHLGLSVQLITGTMFYWQNITLGRSAFLSKDHEDIINREYKTIADTVSADKMIVTAIMRIGQSADPSTLSPKKKPSILYT